MLSSPLLLLLFGVLVLSIDAALLPTYITQCDETNPKMDKCLIRSANLAIPHLVKGDIQYNVPNMLPLRMTELVLRHDDELVFRFKNVEVHGIENTKVISIIYKRNPIIGVFKFTNPAITLIGNYEIYGKLCDSTVSDAGYGNITLADGSYDIDVHFDIRSDGSEKFFKATDNKASIATERVTYALLSSFPASGSNLNEFMNANSDRIAEELRPYTSRIVSSFVTSIIEGVIGEVPLNERGWFNS